MNIFIAGISKSALPRISEEKMGVYEVQARCHYSKAMNRQSIKSNTLKKSLTFLLVIKAMRIYWNVWLDYWHS